MRPAEFLRLFVKSDPQAVPKSARQADPFGLIVRHNLNMGLLYFGMLNSSSHFLIFFKKNFDTPSNCFYKLRFGLFPFNCFLIIPNQAEKKTQSTRDDLQQRSCHCKQINISKGGWRPQPIAFGALLLFITTSIAYPVIVNAEKSYFALLRIAEIYSCNELAVAKSKEVDYNGFISNKNLNEVIFREVELEIQNGDITGIFRRNYFKFIDMVNRLYLIDAGISQNSLPGITVFRELNETAAFLSTFGSYSARVFHAIDTNKKIEK
jgi:hypothetical protein